MGIALKVIMRVISNTEGQSVPLLRPSLLQACALASGKAVSETAPELLGPVRVCADNRREGEFKLQLALNRGCKAEIGVAEHALRVLDQFLGPLVGYLRQVEILEHSFGQYAQYALDVNTRTSQYRVWKTMNSQTWVLYETTALEEALAFVQKSLFLGEADAFGFLSRR